EVLEKAKSYGISWLELDAKDVKESDRMHAMKELLTESGFQVASIYEFFEFGKGQQGEEGYALIDAAVQLGVNKAMVIPGFYEDSDEESRSKELEQMISAMKIMIDYAAEKGITVMIEDFDNENSPIATAQQMDYFTKNLPELRIAFDTGNFKYSAQSEREALSILEDKIVHVHCKDRGLRPYQFENRASDSEENHITAVNQEKLYPVPVGSGCIELEYILRRLMEKGYKGVFSIEHFGARDQLLYMKESARWLLEMFH
ncbi:MAG: sugar phosphate isomerase/epimerase, partial [Vallitaleaceae bacterium]|nr:sugar phosphate isomerase/epimerase [Vallitaleaceae bacterium]